LEARRGEEILRKHFEAVEWIEWNPELFPRKLGMVSTRYLETQLFCGLFHPGRGAVGDSGGVGWSAQSARYPKVNHHKAKIRLSGPENEEGSWRRLGALFTLQSPLCTPSHILHSSLFTLHSAISNLPSALLPAPQFCTLHSPFAPQAKARFLDLI